MALAHRQAESAGLAHPSAEYCATMLLTHSWPHEARELKTEAMLDVQPVSVVVVVVVVVGDVGVVMTELVVLVLSEVVLLVVVVVGAVVTSTEEELEDELADEEEEDALTVLQVNTI